MSDLKDMQTSYLSKKTKKQQKKVVAQAYQNQKDKKTQLARILKTIITHEESIKVIKKI